MGRADPENKSLPSTRRELSQLTLLHPNLSHGSVEINFENAAVENNNNNGRRREATAWVGEKNEPKFW